MPNMQLKIDMYITKESKLQVLELNPALYHQYRHPNQKTKGTFPKDI